MTGIQRRRSGIYEARCILPKELAGRPAPVPLRARFPDLVNAKTGSFKLEVSRSLHTQDPNEAKKRGRRVLLAISETIDEAKRVLLIPDLSPPSQPILSTEISEIASEIHAEWLEWDDEQREGGDDRRFEPQSEERSRLFPEERRLELGPDDLGMEEDALIAYGDLLEDEAKALRGALARRNTKLIEPEVVQHLRVTGREMPTDPLTRQRLLQAVLEARVKALDSLLARQRGEVVPTPEVAQPQERGPKLYEAFERWKEGGGAKGTRKPGPNSILEADQAVRRFIEFHGDLRLADITKAKAREFRDGLAKIPNRLTRKLADLPMRELLAKDLSTFPAKEAATVNKLLAMLGGIISRAQAEGHLDAMPGFANPFDRTLRYKLDAREREDRLPFDLSDLRAIFGSSIFTEGDRPKGGQGEAAFWFPLIGLFSGMRLEEIAGLRLCDLACDEETGQWFFDVTPAGGRSVKTATSIRKVPVHRDLERIGLLAYRDTLAKRGAATTDSLWPHVKSAPGRPASATWSKWFGRFRENVGITDARKVFHCFRHTFKRMARDANLTEEMHDALTGHSGRGGVGRGYGRGFSFNALVEAMDRVAPPGKLDFAMKWEP